MLAAFVSVLPAELLGNRTLFALGSLAARFRPGPVLAGALPAIMAKTSAAALLGSALALVPAVVFRVLSAATFLVLAVRWRRHAPAVAESVPSGHVPAAAFATRFFAAWNGGSLALASKALLAATAGVALGRRLGRRRLRLNTLAVDLAPAALAVVAAVH